MPQKSKQELDEQFATPSVRTLTGARIFLADAKSGMFSRSVRKNAHTEKDGLLMGVYVIPGKVGSDDEWVEGRTILFNLPDPSQLKNGVVSFSPSSHPFDERNNNTVGDHWYAFRSTTYADSLKAKDDGDLTSIIMQRKKICAKLAIGDVDDQAWGFVHFDVSEDPCPTMSDTAQIEDRQAIANFLNLESYKYSRHPSDDSSLDVPSWIEQAQADCKRLRIQVGHRKQKSIERDEVFAPRPKPLTGPINWGGDGGLLANIDAEHTRSAALTDGEREEERTRELVRSFIPSKEVRKVLRKQFVDDTLPTFRKLVPVAITFTGNPALGATAKGLFSYFSKDTAEKKLEHVGDALEKIVGAMHESGVDAEISDLKTATRRSRP